MNKIPDRFYLPVTPQGWNYIRQLLDARPLGEVRALADELDRAVAQQIEQANVPPPPVEAHPGGIMPAGKPNGSGAPVEQEQQP